MFCSDCGQPDQVMGKHCTGCGKYLPDTSFNSPHLRYSPQITAGWIVALNCLGLVMSFIAYILYVTDSSRLLSIFLASGAWGMMLGNTANSIMLYRRLRRRRDRKAETPSEMKSTQAHPLPAAADTSQIVNMKSVTEETTALLQVGRDTQRDR